MGAFSTLAHQIDLLLITIVSQLQVVKRLLIVFESRYLFIDHSRMLKGDKTQAHSPTSCRLYERIRSKFQRKPFSQYHTPTALADSRYNDVQPFQFHSTSHPGQTLYR